jgi:enoyl-[acyl-carrier-protein] reductase (NADH)
LIPLISGECAWEVSNFLSVFLRYLAVELGPEQQVRLHAISACPIRTPAR